MGTGTTTPMIATTQATVQRCKPALGTFVEMAITGPYSTSDLMAMSDQAFEAMYHIERIMSFHDPDSELSYINQTAQYTPCIVSPHLETVLQLALTLSKQSNGVYDIAKPVATLMDRGHLPKQSIIPVSTWEAIDLSNHTIQYHQPLLMDLGGIAKGYAVDQALSTFPQDTSVTINAGGDLRMSHWQSKSAWIQTPYHRLPITMQGPALATSNTMHGATII